MNERDKSQANPDIHSLTADQIEAAVNNPQILASIGNHLKDWVLESPMVIGLNLVGREQSTGPETAIGIIVTQIPRLNPIFLVEITEKFRSPLTNLRHEGISCLIHLDPFNQGSSRSHFQGKSYQPLTPEILYSLSEHFDLPPEIFKAD